MSTVQNKTEFAGFTFPRTVTDLYAPRKGKKRKNKEVYTVILSKENNNPDICCDLSDIYSFARRFEYCDLISKKIKHKGWSPDDIGYFVLRGLVAYLPHGKFLAGWADSDSDGVCIERSIFTDEKKAANYADSLAEIAAERKRDYQEKWHKAQVWRDISEELGILNKEKPTTKVMQGVLKEKIEELESRRDVIEKEFGVDIGKFDY